MYISGSCAGFFSMILVSSNFCWLRLDQLFVTTVFWESTDDFSARVRAIKIVKETSTVQTIFLLMMMTSLNICLCMDLVLMLRRPFSNHTGRTSKYVLISTIVSLLTTILYYFETLEVQGKD
jgi:hypothetical protein